MEIAAFMPDLPTPAQPRELARRTVFPLKKNNQIATITMSFIYL
jgi:hypothetical protein